MKKWFGLGGEKGCGMGPTKPYYQSKDPLQTYLGNENLCCITEWKRGTIIILDAAN